MTPERVKTIRHALRRSDGRKPTQRQVSKFLRMGEVSVPRYESGAQIPTESHALLLEMLTDRRTVDRIARANEREGIFSDIELPQRCWRCQGRNTKLEMVEEQRLVICQDCDEAWYANRKRQW
jgi:predicted transcriptional regulator